jgi:small subunit ribosomal protein S7
MRKSKPKKRIILPDPKFNDTLVTRFVNDLMYDGKKSIAYQIFYDAMDIVGTKMKDSEVSPVDVFKKAIRPERKTSISVKNLILYSRKRSGRSMAEKLAGEIVAAYNEEGGAFKKKEDTHRMAEANRAFAHFRF